LKTSCMNEASTYAMNLFGIGGIGLALNLHARSRNAGQWECSPVIGNGVKIIDLVSKLLLTQFCDIAFVTQVMRKINYPDGI
jgi:hypothetical protein